MARSPGRSHFHLCHLWILPTILSGSLAAQHYPGHRIAIGPGTILLVPDSTTGLTLWATRSTRPGYRASPDFVGWFDPDRVSTWSTEARRYLATVDPTGESRALVASDGGSIAIVSREDGGVMLAFGHPSERQRWVIEADPGEVLSLLDTLTRLAGVSRLGPPEGLRYANPTNRRATPDRERGAPPSVRGSPGESWATMLLDRSGAVIPGTPAILWATRDDLGRAVLEVLPGYRYRRKDGARADLRVYQRFRVR